MLCFSPAVSLARENRTAGQNCTLTLVYISFTQRRHTQSHTINPELLQSEPFTRIVVNFLISISTFLILMSKDRVQWRLKPLQ